ncbi:Lupeol synthase [Glycine soja]
MVREKALEVSIDQIRYEDENNGYPCIGNVVKVLCLIARWVEDPNLEAYQLHLARIIDYFWLAKDALKIQSFGSQRWDVALAIQAILSCDLSEEYVCTLGKAHNFIKACQVLENPSDHFKAKHRHISKGAWTFSMQDQGWQVSDCTTEALKVHLLSQDILVCIGLVVGEFAIPMALGFPLWGKSTITLVPCIKLATFCCQNNFLMEDEVRITCQAKTRYVIA